MRRWHEENWSIYWYIHSCLTLWVFDNGKDVCKDGLITTLTITVVMVMMMLMLSDMRIPYSGRGSPSLPGKQPDLPNVAFSSKNPRFKQQRAKSHFLSQSLPGIVRWHRRASGLLTWRFVFFSVSCFSCFSNQMFTYIQRIISMWKV